MNQKSVANTSSSPIFATLMRTTARRYAPRIQFYSVSLRGWCLSVIRARAKRVIEDEDGERQRYLAIKANECKQQTEDESRLLKQAESRLVELDTIISKTYEEDAR